MTEPNPNAEAQALRRWCLGNEQAARCLEKLGEISQVADDVVDGDAQPGDGVPLLLHLALVDLPQNPFWQVHQAALSPVLACAVARWDSANRLAASGDRTDRMFAFVLREACDDLIRAVALIVGGYDHARHVAAQVHDFFHVQHPETFEEWSANHG